MNAGPITGDLPIIFQEVTACAGKVTMLDRISLDITAGGPTAVIGPNGSGKTTLLRAAMGLTAPSHGRITWGGCDTSPLRYRAFVLQRPVMLRRRVVGNLRYALAAAGFEGKRREARIAELLSLVGLLGLEDRPARRLSGGEQQRLALARALARDPRVLFLDEPTANLDPAASKAIEDIVRAISAKGVKVVIATHDLAEARRLSTDTVLLHRGAVIESGPTERFFGAPSTDEARRFIAGELIL